MEKSRSLSTPIAAKEFAARVALTINGEALRARSSRRRLRALLMARKFQDRAIRSRSKPFRVRSFPVVKDLVVDRTALDRIVQAGGFISARTGSAPEANAILIPKQEGDLAMEAAACIGCGACAAACPNASAMLFTAAKVSHLALLPQGSPERTKRVVDMVNTMDAEGFGNCTNTYECEAVCPAEISVGFIAKLNREYAHARLQRSVSE